MAFIVPSDITHLALAGGESGELETLAAIKAGLPSDYTIFHSIYWSHAYTSHTVFGEIDFVVVNRSGAVLLIEQKNGPVEETAAGLVKVYGSTRKSVDVQIRRSLEMVREKFKRQYGTATKLILDYLIYCPDQRIDKLNASALDRNRIVDAAERGNLAGRVHEILGPGSPDERQWAETVLGFFRQTFELVPDIHAHISAQDKQFVRLSGGLRRIVSSIEMTPMRLRVRGSAGSGKTAVARQFFEDAIEAGKRPLLVCFSRPLREKLNASVPPGGRVVTWNGLVDAFLKDRGHHSNYAEMRRDPAFWGKLTEKVPGEDIPPEWMFDTLVVDEGQDFEQEWLETLKLFLRDGYDVLWLEDGDQNVYGKSPVQLDGFVTYRTRENYRSPYAIASFIRRTLPFDFEPANQLPGLGVGVTVYQSPKNQLELVSRIVTALLKQGFRDDDIVILTMHSVTGDDTTKSIFSKNQAVGRYPLSTMTGEYDLFGNQCMTHGRILLDSVRRFKGQQAPAVIVVDVDPDPNKRDYYDQLLLCAMTRATVRLELLLNETNPECARFLE